MQLGNSDGNQRATNYTNTQSVCDCTEETAHSALTERAGKLTVRTQVKTHKVTTEDTYAEKGGNL